MQSTDFNCRITIERKTIARDPDYNTEVIAWVPVVSRVRAQKQDILPSKSEQVEQDIRIAIKPARIRMRYTSGIDSTMRVIVHDETDEIFQIIGGPAELGRREWLEMVIEAYSS